jgi:SAM-dependent methyltransferase
LVSRCKAYVKSVDISEYAISQARQYYSADNLEFECRDILTTPLPENYYDAALLLETLEHISHEGSVNMLKNVYNSIKKDGRIVVSCPLNQFTLRGKIRNAVLVFLRRPPFDPTHVRNITETCLREDLQISGFDVVSVSYLLFERYLPFIQHIPKLANFLAGGIVIEGRK